MELPEALSSVYAGRNSQGSATSVTPPFEDHLDFAEKGRAAVPKPS